MSDEDIRDKIVTFCEMLLFNKGDLTMHDLLKQDMQARDILLKHTMHKVWVTIDESEEFHR